LNLIQNFLTLLQILKKQPMKTAKFSLLLITYIFTNISNLFSQTISGITATQIDKTIQINYDFLNTGTDLYNISIYCSQDGGITYGTELVSVTGDVGTGITGGSSKKILWDVTSDLDELAGDKIKFKIIAKTDKLQSYAVSNIFPKDEIYKFWDEEMQITSIAYGVDKWAVIASSKTNFGLQTWKTRTAFPESDIKELWEQDYRITSIGYGGSLWALVVSKETGYDKQIWRSKVTFPEPEIKEFRSKNYYITDLCFGMGYWILVMSSDSAYTNQTWKTKNVFPEIEIADLWKRNYEITSLTYGAGLWAVVMTEGSNYITQMWKTSYTFPDICIKEQGALGYLVTSVAYGNGLWAVVVSKFKE